MRQDIYGETYAAVSTLRLITPQRAIFRTSGTFKVPPNVSKIKVKVWGGGSSGASSTNTSNSAPGGAAGGYAEGQISVTAGENVTITIGARGASVSGSNNGNAGGTSSVAAISKTISATGGGAPVQSAPTTTSPTPGTGSNGDINYSGGTSGTISSVRGASGGGGAAGPYGNGANSGTSVTRSASGGASARYSSGNATNASSASAGASVSFASANNSTAQAGSGAPGVDSQANGLTGGAGVSLGRSTATQIADAIIPLSNLTLYEIGVASTYGKGGDGVTGSALAESGGPGAGGGAGYRNGDITGGDGGLCGGGGGGM